MILGLGGELIGADDSNDRWHVREGSRTEDGEYPQRLINNRKHTAELTSVTALWLLCFDIGKYVLSVAQPYGRRVTLLCVCLFIFR